MKLATYKYPGGEVECEVLRQFEWKPEFWHIHIPAWNSYRIVYGHVLHDMHDEPIAGEGDPAAEDAAIAERETAEWQDEREVATQRYYGGV